MWLDTGQGAPAPQAAAVLQAVIEDQPRDPTAALILADAALTQALGWTHVFPLLALGLTRGDLLKTDEELRLACHRAIAAAAGEATREAADLARRAARLAGGWVFRTRPVYAAAIRAAADVGEQDLDLREYDVAVLAAIAYHQPITRDGLKDIFGKEISRDLIGRLHAQGLIGTGPRSPRRGAP